MRHGKAPDNRIDAAIADPLTGHTRETWDRSIIDRDLQEHCRQSQNSSVRMARAVKSDCVADRLTGLGDPIQQSVTHPVLSTSVNDRGNKDQSESKHQARIW